MPRESIYPSTPQQTEDIEGNSLPQPFLLQVGWNRDMDAQVGISLPDGETFVNRFYGDTVQQSRIGERLRAWLIEGEYIPANYFPDEDSEDSFDELIGEEVVNVMDEVRGPIGVNDGLWVNLTRDMANRLIRLVRKARDGAYGSDA